MITSSIDIIRATDHKHHMSQTATYNEQLKQRVFAQEVKLNHSSKHYRKISQKGEGSAEVTKADP